MSDPLQQQQLTTLWKKQLSTVEQHFVAELAEVEERYQREMAELKQVIMLQDSLYRSRLSSLEEQVAKLSQRSQEGNHVLSSTSAAATERRSGSTLKTATLGQTPRSSVSRRATSRDERPGTAPTPSRQRTTSEAGRAVVGAVESSASSHAPPPAVRAVLSQHHSRIRAIYDYYAASNVGEAVFHPSLGMNAFAKLVRDCGLCGRPGEANQTTTPDLLWMAVVRGLHAHVSSHEGGGALALASTGSTGASPSAPSRSTLMVAGKFQATTPQAKDRLDFLRVEKVSQRHFGEALYLLWKAWAEATALEVGETEELTRPAKPSEDAEASAFAQFLTQRVFPTTAVAMGKRRRRESLLLLTSSYRSAASAATARSEGGSMSDVPQDTRRSSAVATPSDAVGSGGGVWDGPEPPRDLTWVAQEQYGSSAGVKAVVKEFAADIKRSFLHFAQHGGRAAGSGMDVDDFFALVQRYHLLPLIKKTDIRDIFDACVPLVAKGRRDMGMSAFVEALFCLAECIYNVPAVAHHYPTPESRVQKLFTKMFVLGL